MLSLSSDDLSNGNMSNVLVSLDLFIKLNLWRKIRHQRTGQLLQSMTFYALWSNVIPVSIEKRQIEFIFAIPRAMLETCIMRNGLLFWSRTHDTYISVDALLVRPNPSVNYWIRRRILSEGAVLAVHT